MEEHIKNGVELSEKSDNLHDAKRYVVDKFLDALQQALNLRYQSLITLSSIAFAVGGIAVATDGAMIKTKIFIYISFIISCFVSLLAMGRYMFLVRKDINEFNARLILETSKQKIQISSVGNKISPNLDWWPEILFGFFILSCFCLMLSLIDFHPEDSPYGGRLRFMRSGPSEIQYFERRDFNSLGF